MFFSHCYIWEILLCTALPNILQKKEEGFSTKHMKVSDNLAGHDEVPGMEWKAQNRYPGNKKEVATKNLL